MKSYFIISVFFSSLSLFSCNKCKDISCFTPPAPFEIKFLDSQTKENLITNGTYSFDQIGVVNTENGNRISFDTISYEDENFIRLLDIGWKTEIVNYSIFIPTEFEFIFHVDAARLEGECCNFTQINEVSISNYEYEKNTSSELISVFIKR